MAGETKSTSNKASGAPSRPVSPNVKPPRAERRPEMIEQRRDQRRQLQEKRKRQWLYVRLGMIALAVLVVVGIGYTIYSIRKAQEIDRQKEALNVVPEGILTDFAFEGNDHIQPGEPQTVEYAQIPPVGGKHDSVWQNCGYYDQPVRNENAVHSLEHGVVWITYRPDLPVEQIEKLKKIAVDEPKVLVSPYDGLPAPIVASAWNRQLLLESADDIRIKQFVTVFQDAATAPEPGGSCSRGVGSPTAE
jgi:hypothetical protein